MAGLVPAIHVLLLLYKKDVDARHKAGHDDGGLKRQPQRSSIRGSRTGTHVVVKIISVTRQPCLRGIVKHCLIRTGVWWNGDVMRLWCCFPRGLLAGAAIGVLFSGSAYAQSPSEFPFGTELRMDARPMKGSKRVPFLQIESNGSATIDLWCDSVQSQFVVAADTVTILIGQKTARTCSQAQASADDALLDALQQTTNWKRDGDGIVLIGPQQLRFRPSTN